MSKILVIRFSAIGDVAMTIPVIYSLARQYPQHEVVVLSNDRLRPLFRELPANVSFVGADLKGEHAGCGGLRRLYRQLKSMNFDYVADFHGVLRAKYVSLRLLFTVIKTATIHKGRKGKSKLVRHRNKVMLPQKSSFLRYADVLQRLGLPVSLEFTSIYGTGKGDFEEIASVVEPKGNQRWIGIAPFAKHVGKIYPVELQEQVVAHFSAQPNVRVFLFGGGSYEQAVFESWTAKYPSVISMIGKLNMGMELNLISHLDVMLSMDSANMHLASLVNTPVVSVWGATHPYAGFMGWGQRSTHTIQVDLPCRPCSVYGQKPCFRKDYACLWQIQPERIIARIESVIAVK